MGACRVGLRGFCVGPEDGQTVWENVWLVGENVRLVGNGEAVMLVCEDVNVAGDDVKEIEKDVRVFWEVVIRFVHSPDFYSIQDDGNINIGISKAM